MESVFGVENGHSRLSKYKLTLIVMSILTVNLVDGITVKTKKSVEGLISQYDHNGKLMKDSVQCSSAMGHAFTSQYLPDVDIYSPTMKGMKIFKPFPNSCYKSHHLHITKTKVDNFANTGEFYRKLSSDTSVGLVLAGKFTMGATLNVKTESLSAGKTNQ